MIICSTIENVHLSLNTLKELFKFRTAQYIKKTLTHMREHLILIFWITSHFFIKTHFTHVLARFIVFM